MDFSLHPEGYGNTLAYRQQKKQEIINKYSANCHDATMGMFQEIGVANNVSDIVEHMGMYSFVEPNGSRETKIVRYVDMRVDPWSITSLDVRMGDAKTRYTSSIWAQEPLWSSIVAHAHEQETLLFDHITINPEDITNESTAVNQKLLWEYNVKNIINPI